MMILLLFFGPRATRTAYPGNRPRPPWRLKRRTDGRSLLSSEDSPGRGEEPTADRQLPEAPPPVGVEQHSPEVAHLLPLRPGWCTCDCGGGRRLIFDLLTSFIMDFFFFNY